MQYLTANFFTEIAKKIFYDLNQAKNQAKIIYGI